MFNIKLPKIIDPAAARLAQRNLLKAEHSLEQERESRQKDKDEANLLLAQQEGG